MAESTTKKSQRRSLAAEPFEQLDAEAEGEDGQAPQAGETLKQAAVVAAVTAGAGALIGVAKALLERREGHEPSSTGTREAGETREADEPREADEVDADEPQAGAPESAAADEPDWDEEEEQEEPEDERSDAEDDDDDLDLDDAAHARSDPAEIVVKAREQLRGLLGREPESVSGIERTNGHWSVTIEVIELHRIPDSTDVLASYELVLDDDGNVARMVRRRRYLRSQIEARS